MTGWHPGSPGSCPPTYPQAESPELEAAWQREVESRGELFHNNEFFGISLTFVDEGRKTSSDTDTAAKAQFVAEELDGMLILTFNIAKGNQHIWRTRTI